MAAVDLELGYHGHPVVRGVSLALRAGEVTALVGPNGSGKSTVLRALARLHRPEHGDVLIAGDSALGLAAKEYARKVTLLSQSRPTRAASASGRWSGTAGTRTAVGGAARTRTVRGPSPGPWRSPAPSRWRERPVDELSGGELQRVWLATCLAQDTGILLLDEPTTFLDLRYQVEILDLVRDLADQHRVAVGIVLHDLNQAAAIADHLVLLADGQVRASRYAARGAHRRGPDRRVRPAHRGAPRPRHQSAVHPSARPAHRTRPRPGLTTIHLGPPPRTGA